MVESLPNVDIEGVFNSMPAIVAFTCAAATGLSCQQSLYGSTESNPMSDSSLIGGRSTSTERLDELLEPFGKPVWLSEID